MGRVPARYATRPSVDGDSGLLRVGMHRSTLGRMEVASSHAEAVARLDAVRTRTRELLSGRRWLKDVFRHSVEHFDLLCRGFRAKEAKQLAAEYDLARTLLKSGRYVDPTATSPGVTVRFEGLCPAALATKIGGQVRPPLSRSIEKKVAAAALVALEHHIVFQSTDTSEQVRDQMAEETCAAVEAGTHVRFSWRIDMDRPQDWITPPNPHSLEQEHLARFCERDFRAIAMYRLGGLADAGSVRPIFPKLPKSTDPVATASSYLLWRYRLPIEDGDVGSESPVLEPNRFPPLLAEEMLEIIMAWATGQEGEPSQQPPVERLRRAARALSPVLASASLFREISERRAEQRKSRVALANTLGARSFASFEEAAKSAQLASGLVEQVTPEPAEFINQLRDMLDSGVRACEIASRAIREGGADVLDDALTPGTKSRSVAWEMKVRETDSLFWSLAMAIGVPGASFADDVTRMLTLGEWFATATAELEAVVAVSGAVSGAQVAASQGKVPKRRTAIVETRPVGRSESSPARDGDAPSSLSRDHEAMLRFLSKKPGACRTVTTIAGDGPFRNRETVGRLLAELSQCDLVYRPYGVQKGYALTKGGLDRARSLESDAANQ